MASFDLDIPAFLGNVWAVLRGRWYFRHASHLGEKVRVWGHPVVHNWGRMVICDRVRVISTLAKVEILSIHGGTLEIGESAFINYGSSIVASQMVRIGPGCNIGTHVIILDNNFHHLEPALRNERPESAPVLIEENVWLGARVIVLPGIQIGAWSVIGAGSVVTRDIPPGVLAAGNPARVIRNL
jgi:serine acetyltransferase